MKKITYFVCSIFLLIIIHGCVGYEPIFESNNLNFKISSHSIEGNKILGKKIYSKLFNLSQSKKNNQDLRNVSIYIDVSKSKIPTSKNISGKILEYKIDLIAKIKIEDDVTGEDIINQSFEQSMNYKVQDRYSKTLDLENKTVGGLLDNMYQDLLINFINNIESP